MPKKHHLQNEMGLHHKTCHRSMRAEGWLKKKVQSRGIAAIHKKPNPVVPVKGLHEVLDPRRKMWVPNHLRDDCTKFPALSFASAVGEDSIHPLVPGSDTSRLSFFFNKKSHVCTCGAAPLYSGIQLRLTFSRLRSSVTWRVSG